MCSDILQNFRIKSWVMSRLKGCLTNVPGASSELYPVSAQLGGYYYRYPDFLENEGSSFGCSLVWPFQHKLEY